MSLSAASMHTLNGLLKEGLYKIPDYQRRYSWEEKQTKELFYDLWEGFTDNTDHYLGTLSLREGGGYGKFSTFEIIDGQQRFTSTLILFAVIANYDDADDYSIEDIRTEYKGDYIYFLEPRNEEEKKFFIAILEGQAVPEPTTKSQECMKNAYDNFKKYLAIQKIDNTADKLTEKFAQYIMKRVNFLINLVKDEISANRMFEAINDRGLPLKYFDKLKSFLLYQSNKKMSSHLNTKIIETFDKIYKFLDNKEYILDINNDDNLFIYHFQSNPVLFEDKWNYTASINNIYNLLKADISEKGEKYIIDYLIDIAKFIDAVDKIEQQLKQENKKYIEFYRIISPHAYMYPFTIRLEILGLLNDNIDDLIIINFYQRAHKRQAVIMNSILDIMKKNTDVATEKSISSEIEKISSKSSNKTNSLEDIAQYDWATKYILWVYSKEKYNQYIPYNTYRKLQIEHICPQNPTTIKPLGWGVKEQYDLEIESIGNKLLLEEKINNKLNNKLPSEKIMTYPKSIYKMNHNIIVQKKPDVQAREKELVKFIKEYLNR